MINNKITPVINEKSIFCLELDSEQYTFDVCAKLSKPEIKKLMENTFQLKVAKLTTQTQPRIRRSARLGGSLGSHVKRIHVIFKKPAPLLTQYWSFSSD
jgi:ribosomal protein L23